MCFVASKNGVNQDFELYLTLKEKVDRSTKLEILINVFYTFGPHLMILAWTGGALSRGQTRDCGTHTDMQTDTGNENTRRPKLGLR